MKNYEFIKKVSEEELQLMRNKYWFMDNKRDNDDRNYLLQPFYKVHNQERKAAMGFDNWISKKLNK